MSQWFSVVAGAQRSKREPPATPSALRGHVEMGDERRLMQTNADAKA